MIPFNQIENKVPEWLETLVETDNVEFVIDRQVFDDKFFTLMSLILKHIANNMV
jgi:hypothetical protein